MPEAFLSLSPEDQREALQVAAGTLGRTAQLLEKDVWVVWTLRALFESDEGRRLVFKGGTSLSKVYGAIDRFSEDIDLTYDVTRLVGDLVEKAQAHGYEKMPATGSQARKWTKAVETALPAWIAASAIPILSRRIQAEGLAARLEHDGEKLYLRHPPAVTVQAPYAAADVLMEFGGRSSGLPVQAHVVVCDAAAVLPDLEFPTAHVRAMDVARTVWEKATAVHVFCKTGLLKGERLARHWYDLVQLEQKGHAAAARANREIAEQVARHKTLFFDVKGVDYFEAIGGGLRLVPEGDLVEALKADYTAMREGGLLNVEAPTFEDLLAASQAIQNAFNT